METHICVIVSAILAVGMSENVTDVTYYRNPEERPWGMEFSNFLKVLKDLMKRETKEPADVPSVITSSDSTIIRPTRHSRPLEKRLRRRRMSCDLLSFPMPLGALNHATCATYCFINGKNFRGRCEFGWCKCK